MAVTAKRGEHLLPEPPLAVAVMLLLRVSIFPGERWLVLYERCINAPAGLVERGTGKAVSLTPPPPPPAASSSTLCSMPKKR